RKAGKAQKSIPRVIPSKIRGREERRDYSIYIYKVFEASTSDTGVSSKAMVHHELFVNDIFEENRRRVFLVLLITTSAPPLNIPEIQDCCQASPFRKLAQSTRRL
ncbi:UNVERIFIED_CONTAM: hypothetical protein GTU68_030924, partial [Idotea baltica]|nr:hypothetical protein [Idotea baltica]